MSAETNKRTTSLAKSVDGLAREESALDRALRLKEHFEQAKAAQAQSLQQEQAQQKTTGHVASRTIRKHAPRHNLNPPSPMRQGPDRQAYLEDHKKDVANENKKLERAKEALDRLNERLNQQKTVELDQGRDKDDKDNDDRSR